LFENPPRLRGCAVLFAGAGVLGAVAGVVGSVMAGEALKILLGLPAAFGRPAAVQPAFQRLADVWRCPDGKGWICSPTTAARSASQNPPG
jgi:molybdopterin/thiamine biosynthesis adenylyltransferase